MLATSHRSPAASRSRSRRSRRHHAPERRLLCESLERRLLLAGDSWVATTVFPATVGIQSIATDTEGGVYVAFNGPSSAETDYDIYLKKYDKVGEEQWTRGYQIPDLQIVYDIAIGQDGVFIVGSFRGTLNLDDNGSPEAGLVSTGNTDGFLAKFRANDGQFLWQRAVGDGVDGVAVAGESVFVLAGVTTEVNKNSFIHETLIGRFAQDTGEVEWQQTFEPSIRGNIAVVAPASEPIQIYVGGTYSVAKLTEPVNANSTFDWIRELGDTTWSGRIAVGTEVIDGIDVPSLFIARQTTTLAAELTKVSDAGEIVWSASMTSDVDILTRGVAVDGGSVYVTGRFNQQALFDDTVPASSLASSGDRDGFLARYGTVDGHLTAVQRMGGSASDYGWGVSVGSNRVYVVGGCRSDDANFPAALPGQMSAFVPTIYPPGDLFVMQLDILAPIVNIAEPTITVREGEPVTLIATTSAGTIVWYESGVPLEVDAAGRVTLGVGTHLISAIATDDQGRIGMTGVVVNVINSETYTSTDTPKQMADAHPSKGAGLTTSQIAVSNTSVTAIGTLSVGLSITHSAPSQLKGVLVGPDGTSETLFDRPSALQATYETTLFVGKPLSGTWTLRLEDHVRGTVGTLNSWSITASPQVVQNLPPVAEDDSYTVSWNQTLTLAAPGVLANDGDPNGDTLTAKWVEGPAYGTLEFNSDGSFTYTPDDDFVGIDEFTYEVSDGEFYRAATVTIHVVNRYPIAVNDGYSTAFNTPLVVSKPGVLANDSDPDGDPLTAVLLSGLDDPSSGTLTWAGDGSFTFAPAEGYDGTVSFTYQVTDKGGLESNDATVTINVAPEEGQELTFSSIDVPKTIADPHPTQGVRPTVSQLVIADTGATIGSLFRLDLAISHSRSTDLSAVLRSPGNIEAVVFPQGTTTLPTQWTTDAFAGQPLDGTWQLILRDHVRGTTGTLTAWSITVSVESGGGLLTLFGQGDDQSSDKLRGMLAGDATLGDHDGFFDDSSNTDDAVRMLYDVDETPDDLLRVGTPDRVATRALDRLMARRDRPAPQPLEEVLEELFAK